MSRVPYRTPHMVLEVCIQGLPPGSYSAQVTVHDAVSGKDGKLFIPFRVAAKPGSR